MQAALIASFRPVCRTRRGGMVVRLPANLGERVLEVVGCNKLEDPHTGFPPQWGSKHHKMAKRNLP